MAVIAKDFKYNGRMGSDFLLQMCFIGGKKKDEDQLTGIDRSPVTTHISSQSFVFDYGAEEGDPLEFQTTLWKFYDDESHHRFSREEQRDILFWLTSDSKLHWLDIYGDDVDEFCYLCRPTEVTKRVAGGEVIGFDITWTTNSTLSYSKEIVKEFTLDGENQEIEIYIDSDTEYLYPKIELTPIRSNITMTNITDGNRESKFTEITPADPIHFDCVNKKVSSASGILFSEKFNWKFFRFLPRVKNVIRFSDPCSVKFVYRLGRKVGEY